MKALLEMLVAYCAFMNLCVFETAKGSMLLVFTTPPPAVDGKGDIYLLAFDLESAPDCLSTFVKLRVGTGTLGFVLLRLETAPSSASL